VTTEPRAQQHPVFASVPISVSILLALSIPVFLYQLGGYGLVSGDEAFYHGVAESMVETGNWFSIDFRGQHRPYDTFMNAPLQYWLRAGLIEMFGSNYWTMRITSASFGVACVLMTYWMLLPIAGGRAALFAGLIQLTTFQFVYLHSARSGVVETALAFLFALIAHLFMAAIRGRRGFIAHHLCIAALLNLKLPIALIPLMAELAYFAIDRDARRHAPKWLLSGIAIVPIGLGWHFYQAFALDQPVAAVMRKMASQGSGDVEFLAARARNLRFYAGTFLYGAFPYALLYPWAIWTLLRRPAGGDSTGALHAQWRLFALFAGSVFVFFLVVGKHSGWYLIPAFSFLSAFLGAQFARAMDVGLGRGASLGLASFVALLLWVNVGLGVVNPFDPFAGSARTTARFVTIGNLEAWLGVPLTIAVLTALIRRLTRGDHTGRGIATALVLVSIGYATLRVSLPLSDTSYTSTTEAIWRDLATMRAVNFPIEFPVVVPQGSPISAKSRLYFSNDYDISPRESSRPRAAVGYLLYAKGEAPTQDGNDADRGAPERTKRETQ
jgi:4-amino-4-deoxy-L-arabinose transferase-like glycosyltransferase